MLRWGVGSGGEDEVMEGDGMSWEGSVKEGSDGESRRECIVH